MKKYVYLLKDKDNNVVAIYDRSDLASKLKPTIEVAFGTEITIEKKLVNPDVKYLKQNG